MKSAFCLGVGLLLCTQAIAQNDWVSIGGTADVAYHIKAGSLETTLTKAKVPIAVVVCRTTRKSTQEVIVYKWYVTLSDCERKMGQLVSLGVDGAFRFENEFVFSAGNMSSDIAESICGAHAAQKKSHNDKSL